MRNCIDEGTLQAWFDGEWANDEAANLAAHLSNCDQCAAAATAVEAENLMLSEALAPEFAAPVPTERLRQRVDSAVANLRYAPAPIAKKSRLSAFAEFFSFRPLAYASVAAMIVLVAIIGFVYLKNQKPTSVANNNQSPAVKPSTPEKSPELVKQQSPEQPPNSPAPKPVHVAGVHPPKEVRIIKPVEPNATSIVWQERQYENAIAKLDDALKTQPPMRPALQVDYEYNMAVIDSAIKTTRDVAKKNPKDPLANQFMLAAYQSKVDFMNQIADARGLGR
jgi:negative regulator of sigma E activity